MPKLSLADRATPLRVVIVTMDRHLAGPLSRALPALNAELPGLTVDLHAASDWAAKPETLDYARADIARADIILASMLFLEDHFAPILPALKARRDHCDAMVCAASASDVVKLTRMGGFTMEGKMSGPLALLKKLRPSPKAKSHSAGAQQMMLLRRIPQILRFIPGKAQDVRAYFLTLQYWMCGSDQNIANMLRLLISKYADGPREVLRSAVTVGDPLVYPDVGVYHPRMNPILFEKAERLPAGLDRGTVGLLLLRSYLLSGDAKHYDGVIAALEARGLNVVPVFASGLDARPAIDKYFFANGHSKIDALVSLTGFSLVGGPAYNDSKSAEAVLARLDVPYIAAQPLEFQSLEEWESSDRGLLPVESTIMVAIPELDGATGPIVYGGRSRETSAGPKEMRAHTERVNMLAARVAKLVALRQMPRKDRKVSIVLFNFPPNAGNTGTAAFLAVFESLFNLLTRMKTEGYTVTVPASVDDLRRSIVTGNAERFGAHANVHARIPAGDHIRREPHLKEIEAQWGPAPGRQQSDGSSIFVLGERFGNVFVGLQPSMGYEGDPMRLLFEKGFAPTHAFSAFYRWLREDFGAAAVLHFGTHGALEFMPGKQAGLSATCWPDRLIRDLPNIYLYASNNPSEGAVAKRRSAATLVSYLTPPVAAAGLYKGLVELKASLMHWRGLMPDAPEAERAGLGTLIQSQAAALELAGAEPAFGTEANAHIAKLWQAVLELEYTLIPHGLHVAGAVSSREERIDMLLSVADATHGLNPARESIAALVDGAKPEQALMLSGLAADDTTLAAYRNLAQTAKLLAVDHELGAVITALDGRYLRPAPGGDLLRTPSILPTGRNLHGFDPFRIPSAYAVADGARQADRLIARHMGDGFSFPETIAMVLWGTDNLKSEGAPISQALALVGALPRFDGYGRIAGATLVPLEKLRRPRIDVVITVSGIFRDLMPLQLKLLAEACLMAAGADESGDQNFLRKHALEYQRKTGCDLATAALRVFGNADGAYGSNVNNLVESGRWDDEDELAETYSRRKSFAYDASGRPSQRADLLQSVLADVQLAYQNLDSVELGVTTVDTYFDTLGGISRATKRAKGGAEAPVYIGDQTRGEGAVRTLTEQVSLETRTRMLNPKWYEGMLKHGYEGVRQIEVHVTNTMGWSATTGQVSPWVYQQISETFVLDQKMRERLALLNPTASARVAHRLLEAYDRKYWMPDGETLNALRSATDELEDRLEGIGVEAAA